MADGEIGDQGPLSAGRIGLMSLPTTALSRDGFYLPTNGAVVTAVAADGGIELDQTCFYATPGGQPGDTGFLERTDGSRIALGPAVTGATKEIILHYPLEGEALPLVG